MVVGTVAMPSADTFICSVQQAAVRRLPPVVLLPPPP
eukprot:COSAG06_NODE_15975_length_1031_cov_2.549356_1_plen_36_part_10